MKKIIMRLIFIIWAGSLCACSTRMDRKGLNNTEAEETETQISDELEKVLPTEVEEPENEHTVDKTEEISQKEIILEQM